MKILPTRRVDYGIRALLWLARSEDGSGTAKQIATDMEMPKGFLHQVMQTLVRAGLVVSQAGRTGGYRLAAEPSDISILQIVEGLEGPIEDGGCAMRGGPCHWEDVCALHWVWSTARGAMVDGLRNATLADVSEVDLALLEQRIPIPQDSHRR